MWAYYVPNIVYSVLSPRGVLGIAEVISPSLYEPSVLQVGFECMSSDPEPEPLTTSSWFYVCRALYITRQEFHKYSDTVLNLVIWKDSASPWEETF